MFRSKLQTTLVASLLAAFTWHAGAVRAGSGTEQFDLQMQPILESYVEIGDRLAADSIEGVGPMSERIAKLA